MMKIKNYQIYQKEKVKNILFKNNFFLDIKQNKENKQKVFCEDVIPEEDEEKQKTEIKFYNKNNISNNEKNKNDKIIINNNNIDNEKNKNFKEKGKKPSYLKKIVIDVNNNNNFNNNNHIINERNSISPILNTVQNINSNLIINNNNLDFNPLFTSWSTNKFNYEKEKEREKNHISKLIQSNQTSKFYLPDINNNQLSKKLLKNNLKNNNNTINNNINNNLDTQSTTNDSKKNSNSNNTDEYSKDRIDLLSAKLGTNLNINSASNNIIIPMIPLRRPNSNFNFGGNLLWEKMENLNTNILNTENIIEKNNFNSRNTSNNNIERGKVSTAPLINNNNNLKLHKIKIEKGMMNTKFADTINRKMKIFELNEYYLNGNLYNKNDNQKNNVRSLINNRKLHLKIKRDKNNSDKN